MEKRGSGTPKDARTRIVDQEGVGGKRVESRNAHPDVGYIASLSKPKKVVLSHILFWGNTEESIIEEVKSNYEGEVIIAEDLMVIE